MNIVFCTREYPPETQWGGESIACRDMAKILADSGHIVHVVTQSINKKAFDYKDGNVIIHRVGSNAKRYSVAGRINYTFFAVIKILKITRGNNKWIINGFYWGTDIFIYTLLKFLRLRKDHLILHAHGSIRDAIYDTNLTNGIVYHIMLRTLLLISDFTARHADIIIAISESIKKELVEKSNISENKIRLIITPRDNKKYVYTPSNLKNHLGIGNSKQIVLTVGRLEQKKGIHILLSAIPLVQKELPQTIFIFVGSDTPRSPIKNVSYKQYVLREFSLDFKDTLIFLENLSQDDLIKLYSIADVVVSASLYEISTSVPLEAMSCGKPVVVTNTGNATMLKLDGDNGKVVQPGNIKALAEAIIDILKINDKQRESVAIKNREIIEKDFSFAKWESELVELLYSTSKK